MTTEKFAYGFNGDWTLTDSTNGREAYTMYNEQLGKIVYWYWISAHTCWQGGETLGVDLAYVYCNTYELTDCVDGAVYQHDGTQWTSDQDAAVSWQSCTQTNPPSTQPSEQPTEMDPTSEPTKAPTQEPSQSPTRSIHNWFGIKVADYDNADSDSPIMVSMWYNNIVHRCTFDAVARNTEYICTKDIWTIEDRGCFDNSSDYKMLIENEHNDALILDSVSMQMDGIRSTIEAWCIPNGDQPSATNGLFEYSNNTCSHGYIAWDMTCIADELGCAPHRIMLSFDMDRANGTSFNALWTNAVDLCLIPEHDGCSCPETLDPTWLPTNSPTFEPTTGPSFEPTFEPTIYPTLEPTSEPSMDPTMLPTTSPTFGYASWYLQAGGYESAVAALNGQASCDELDALHTFTNREGRVFASDMPFGGFKSELWSKISNQIRILPPMFQFWKPSYLETDAPFFQMYFASYLGVHVSYPPKSMDPTYNPLVRPWYRAASSQPDVFVITTPYTDFSSGELVASGAAAIRAPNSTKTFGVAAFDYDFRLLVSYWNNTLSAVCQRSEGQYCYLVDSSGFLLYYDGIADEPDRDDISHQFFGDVEPTLMQNLLDIGFFTNRTHSNFLDNTLDVSYTVDHDVYLSLQLNQTGRSFACNSGQYTVHQITRTNLYVIYVDAYALTNLYPVECPDNAKCPSVRSPGCITDHLGDCASIAKDVCSTPETPIIPSATCSVLTLGNNTMRILEDGVESDFCASCFETVCDFGTNNSSESGGDSKKQLSPGGVGGIVSGSIFFVLFALSFVLWACDCKFLCGCWRGSRYERKFRGCKFICAKLNMTKGYDIPTYL